MTVFRMLIQLVTLCGSNTQAIRSDGNRLHVGSRQSVFRPQGLTEGPPRSRVFVPAHLLEVLGPGGQAAGMRQPPRKALL